MTKILVNHLGYSLSGQHRAVFQSPVSMDVGKVFLVHIPGRIHAAEAIVNQAENIDSWKGGEYREVSFDGTFAAGLYRLEAETSEGPLYSEVFALRAEKLANTLFPSLLNFFGSMRCIGQWEKADHSLPVAGSSKKADVHGGWYDASGDISKYLSHLSYANFMNPQQIPVVVWQLLESSTLLEGHRGDMAERLRKEGVYGADFLVRMLDDSGAFYSTVFDQWSKDPKRRILCSYRTQEGVIEESWQAGFRQGGGLSIAALARASSSGIEGDYSPEIYREKAEVAFAHLQTHNTEYLPDGTENILDDYCALMAATELWKAGKKENHAQAASNRAHALASRFRKGSDGELWWMADDADRPYWHAVEAGLPIIALLNWIRCGKDPHNQELERVVLHVLKAEIGLSEAVFNPFGLARQKVQDIHGNRRDSFFIPHENESGYWWQGENARLASLAAAAHMARRVLSPTSEKASILEEYATNQLNWILGLNPFDSCMLNGFGRNNPEYMDIWPSLPGGICNGITAGLEDESKIEFCRSDLGELHDWRWAEQWIPHVGWFLLALALEKDGEYSP